MEEKERYEYLKEKGYIVDNKDNEKLISYPSLCQLLNTQYKQIKEIRERLELKLEELHIAYCAEEHVKTKKGNLKEETQQLKQSQKQLAIEKLRELINYIDNGNSNYYRTSFEIKNKIIEQLEELQK